MKLVPEVREHWRIKAFGQRLKVIEGLIVKPSRIEPSRIVHVQEQII
jgi:hypothetical protein